METNIDELNEKRMSLVERFEVLGMEKKETESSQGQAGSRHTVSVAEASGSSHVEIISVKEL